MSRARKHKPVIANDNEPAHIRPRGDAVGFNHMLRQRQSARHEFDNRHAIPLELDEPLSGKGDWVTKLGFFCLFASLIAVMIGLATPQAAGTRLIALAALAWTGLWTTYLASDSGQPRLAAASTLLATLGGLGIWVVAATQLGLPLSPADGAGVFAGVMTLTALCLRSKMALLVSTCASFMWLVTFTQLSTINSLPLWGLPVLSLVQLVLASHYKTGLSAMMALISTYGWLGYVMMQLVGAGDISLLHASGVTALIGFSHYRFGKTAGDSQMPFAVLHVIMGWSIAVLGGLMLQHYWLGTGSTVWDELTSRPAGVFGWTIVSYSLVGLIVVGTAMRWFGGRGSAIGTLAVSSVAAAIVVITGHTDSLSAMTEAQLGLPAMPSAAFIIGAVISASAIAMTINGARRRIWIMMAFGLLALAAQAVLLSNPQLWNADISVIFGISFITCLCVAALLAAESTHPNTATQRRVDYAYYGAANV